MSADHRVDRTPTERLMAGETVRASDLADDIESGMADGLDLTGWDVLDALARAGHIRMDVVGTHIVVRWDRSARDPDADAGGSAPAGH